MARLLFCFCWALASQAFANPCVFTENNLAPPLNADGGKPVEVEVELYLSDLIGIKDADKSFVADVFLRAEWTDPRLAHGGTQPCSVQQGQVWTPQLQLLNRRKLDEVNDPEFIVAPDGRVRQWARAYGDFSFQADLTDFPFDRQELHFVLVSGEPVEDVVIIARRQDIGIADDLSVSNWKLSTAGSRSSEYYIAPIERTISRLDIVFNAQRLTGYYTWQLLVPLLLVVMMTWAVFWMPLEFVAPRVGLVATSMLTLIAYRFSMASVLPPIAYLTRLDKFLVASSVLVFAALAAAVAVTWLEGRGGKVPAERLNMAARLLAPLLFLAVFAGVFVL
ncbi:MAG: hypothetical protein OEW92_05275 [Gammaproteobacteria bacterium]|nr:hypothetical protein [Gammaproteobacteria bacterium]MDH5171808.1 hypothetical protein [Gammaproteobacteria bacterium]